MANPTRPPLFLTIALVAALLIAAKLAWPPPYVHARTLGQRVEHRLVPGGHEQLRFPGIDVTLAVPAGEGHSIGTLVLSERSADGEELPELVLERNGGLIETWAEDLDGDGRTDLLLVTRSAGSGGYLNLILLHGRPEGFDPELLPSIGSASFPGYMGHGRVEVVDSVIELEFPVYGNHLALADDPLGTLAQGDLPVSLESDSNSNPTDGTRRVRYDQAAGDWR